MKFFTFGADGRIKEGIPLYTNAKLIVRCDVWGKITQRSQKGDHTAAFTIPAMISCNNERIAVSNGKENIFFSESGKIALIVFPANYVQHIDCDNKKYKPNEQYDLAVILSRGDIVRAWNNSTHTHTLITHDALLSEVKARTYA